MPDIRTSDFGGIPYGNTAGRPANPGIGKLYSNGEAQRLELYTADGWNNIVQETPGVSSISGNYSEATDSGVITITGTNFASGCYATAIGSNGVQVDATSTVFNSIVQVTATFTGLSNQYEPYDVKVTNPSNLFGIIPDALYVNASPVWQTSSGSLGTFGEQVSVSVSATATDSDSTITYALANGSSLPSGVSLNSSTGAITGTLPDIASSTTYTFTINASDGLNIIPRTFSITSQAITSSIELLMVAGGGGGGCDRAGGGGAGGLFYNSSYSLTGRSFALSIGTGGAGSTSDTEKGVNGSNTVFGSLVAIGGGGGGSENSKPGSSGGSGGGASYGDGQSGGSALQPGSSSGGFGNRGGNGKDSGGRSPGGGGGAGAQGTDAANNTYINGGNGLQYSITGTSTWYAGGGGAGDNRDGAGTAIGGLGGLGGGGNGGPSYSGGDTNGYPGTDGLGGGGGGGSTSNTGVGAKGGSGVVVLAYPDTYPAISSIPGTLTYDTPTRSGYRVYRFTAGTGTITF